MDDRSQLRLQALPAVSQLTRTREFREKVMGNELNTLRGRELTIITVLPDDTVTYLLARLAEAGSPAVLALSGDDGVRVVRLTEVTLVVAGREPTRIGDE